MYKLNSFQATNFLSFEEVYYKIINGELTMIYGQNNDVSKRKSNGSGKSSFLDIISFGTTGDSLRKLKSIKELIRNGFDSCFVEVEYIDEKENTFAIQRTLSSKSSQKILIIENEIPNDQLKDLAPKKSDEYIQEKLGISFEDILNYYLISKFKYQSLFLAGDTAKKEVINRFSKADLVDNVFEYIDNDLTAKQKEINDNSKKVVELETKIKDREEQLELLVEDNKQEAKKIKIDEIKFKIQRKRFSIEGNENTNRQNVLEIQNKKKLIKEEKKNIIDEEHKTWKELINNIQINNELLTEKKLELKNIKLKYKNEFDLLDVNEKENKNNIEMYEDEIITYHDEIIEIEKYLAGEIECPKCQHHFILANSDFNIDEANKQVEELRKFKNESEEKLTIEKGKKEKNKSIRQLLDLKIKNEGETIQSEIDTISETLETFKTEKLNITTNNNTLKGKISNYELTIKTKESNITYNDNNTKELVKEIDDYESKIKLIEDNTENDEAIVLLNSQIEILTIELGEIKEKGNLLNNEAEKIEEWKLKFKRFKSFLANQALKSIEIHANYFLENMKSDLKISIDGFRELGNGKLKEEITVELSRDGLTSESFGKYSGGEKSLADLSSILAMQSIINQTSNIGLELLAIDEILESIDDEGMNDVINCLNKLNKTIMVIAHSQPNEAIDCNNIIIRKKNKVSRIESNSLIINHETDSILQG